MSPFLTPHIFGNSSAQTDPFRGAGQDSNWNAIPLSIYLETLLPVPLPVLVPIQNLTQSQLVTTGMIEPLNFSPLASLSVALERHWS